MIEHRQILWLLFVRGFKTNLTVGGLGVEDQQNGLREVPLLRHVIYYLWCLAKQEVCRSKSRTCDERRCSFDFSKKSVESVSFSLQKYVQIAGACFEI
jgi:hypothetical protein